MDLNSWAHSRPDRGTSPATGSLTSVHEPNGQAGPFIAKLVSL
jgi:hypothetical protein